MQKIPTLSLVKMAEFFLSNNYFKFNVRIPQQISRTSLDATFAPPYACIVMNEVENEFLANQEFHPLLWLGYIDIFLFEITGRRNLKHLWKILIIFCLISNLPMSLV